MKEYAKKNAQEKLPEIPKPGQPERPKVDVPDAPGQSSEEQEHIPRERPGEKANPEVEKPRSSEY